VESGKVNSDCEFKRSGTLLHCRKKRPDQNHRLLAEPRSRLIVASLGEEGGVGMRTVLFDRRESFGEQPSRVTYLFVRVDCALCRGAAGIRGDVLNIQQAVRSWESLFSWRSWTARIFRTV
jgi:hypothetical protein